MEKISIGKTKINLTPETQISPLGREFRISGCEQVTTIPAKYIDGAYKNHWIYTFKYLDDGTFFKIEVGYRDEFVRKW